MRTYKWTAHRLIDGGTLTQVVEADDLLSAATMIQQLVTDLNKYVQSNDCKFYLYSIERQM